MAVKKKDKARDASFVAFVEEQLAPLGGVRSKSRFGGYGLYARDVFFACVDDGRLYFRVDDTTRARYEERGMGPFTPMPAMVMKSYYEVPVDVIEDAAELMRWARQAMAAVPSKAAKSAKSSRAKAASAGRKASTSRPAGKSVAVKKKPIAKKKRSP